MVKSLFREVCKSVLPMSGAIRNLEFALREEQANRKQQSSEKSRVPDYVEIAKVSNCCCIFFVNSVVFFFLLLFSEATVGWISYVVAGSWLPPTVACTGCCFFNCLLVPLSVTVCCWSCFRESSVETETTPDEMLQYTPFPWYRSWVIYQHQRTGLYQILLCVSFHRKRFVFVWNCFCNVSILQSLAAFNWSWHALALNSYVHVRPPWAKRPRGLHASKLTATSYFAARRCQLLELFVSGREWNSGRRPSAQDADLFICRGM